MLPDVRDFDRLAGAFRWDIPDRFNIAAVTCDRWADAEPGRTAILDVAADGRVTTLTFGAMRDQSNRLAAALARRGIGRGDRVAILLPQSAEVAIAHMALYKLGAVALPLAVLFGADALAYRLTDAGAKAVISNAAGIDRIGPLRAGLPALALLICIDGPVSEPAVQSWAALLAEDPGPFTPIDTGPDDPALMIYTSGTTGPPKGALQGHRVLLGHLPGFQLVHEFFPQPGDLMWTPADWAWAGGFLNALLPSLYFGVPVVARKFEKFEAAAVYDLLVRFGIRNTFVPPTALRMLRAGAPDGPPPGLALRTVASAGEALGADMLAWGRDVLGLTINEAYGQTECNLVIASCAALDVVRAGAIGRPVPGHRVAVIRPDGSPCPPGEAGQIAIARPDPVMFLGYWNRPDATEAKFVGDWMTTGDEGVADEEGYIRFIGRDDDVITSAGYRIGPTEIEDCLMRHPAVALAAVVGKPDPLRTEIVKAFVVLRPGLSGDDALGQDIAAFVRRHLSAHEYPREVAFVDALPLTTTGKIIRRLLREQA